MELVKYKNRKLYDRNLARYATLTQVVEAVRQGKTVKVTDKVTGADVTCEVLSQVVLNKLSLTETTLVNLIRTGSA